MLTADEVDDSELKSSTKTIEVGHSPSSHTDHQPHPEQHTRVITTTTSTTPVHPVHPSTQKRSAGNTTNPFHMHSKINVIPANRKGELNTQYLSTLPGVLKLAEMILGFVSFILAICADRRSTSAAWTEHISFETTMVVTILLLGYVVFPHLTIGDVRTTKGLVVVELLFYGTNTIFYFIGIWLMVHLSASWTAEGRGAAIMDAILCVALCVLYAMETFLKFKMWRGDSNHERTSKAPHPAVPPPPSTHHQYEDNMAELSREHSVV
uniref:MARVEL domain-containing protein n=1 Tax=Ditylenchus dipsaci TaxID=166011 RepID=A0A915EDV1_9BILA